MQDVSTMDQYQNDHHRPRRLASVSIGGMKGTAENDARHEGWTKSGRGDRIRSTRSHHWITLCLLLAIYFFKGAMALQQTYCSSQNTGTAHYNGSYQYQSLGYCLGACSNYAFGILKEFQCWCSDYAPNDANSEKYCLTTCPGYGYENCGNSTAGYFGYIETNKTPKGTAGPNGDSASSTVSDPVDNSTPSPTPSSRTSSASNSVVTKTVYITTSFSSGQSQTPSPTSEGVSVITIDAPTHTVTRNPVISSSTNTPTSSPVKNEGFFSNAGRVAGVFTVIALIIVALVGALLFYMHRRKRRGTPISAESPTPDSFGGTVMGTAQEKRRSRSMSTLGLVTPSERQAPVLPATSAPTAASGGGGSPDRVTDQRLDPGQIWMRLEGDNTSRMSVRSLRDDQDYSRRVLRLTNPDEE